MHHFRLDKGIAEGGMGRVYVGFDLSLQRPVAVKVIRPEYASEQSFAARFIREARAQAQIVHPNVVQVFYVGQEGPTLFMVMELVEGGSLADQLRTSGPLDWKTVHRHLTALAHGLEEGARLGLIHRDIKPDNVLLDRFGEAHLADFGLAAPVTSREAPTLPAMASISSSIPQLTQVGAVMGSPPYMSPEQAAGEALDARSDIYSLGASMLELLTGRPPTAASTLLELQAFHKGPPPAPLLPRRGAVPAAFAKVIDRCLARDKTKRFQSYGELLEALADSAPKPLIDAGGLPRVLAWALDVGIFVAALVGSSAASLDLVSRVFLSWGALLGWSIAGALGAHSTPGLWMMRLGLTGPAGEERSSVRVFLRSLLHHLWVPLAGLSLAALYNSWATGPQLAVLSGLAVTGLLTLVGSVARFVGSGRRTLLDRLTGTRVVVTVR